MSSKQIGAEAKVRQEINTAEDVSARIQRTASRTD